MQPESSHTNPYFDTPARSERLQLVLHLLRNAGEVIYLRAPSGAGKSRFAQRLVGQLGDEIESVWLSALISNQLPQVVADELGLPPESADLWPNGILAGIGGRDLVLFVDDADQLDLPSVQRLVEMHAAGGRLLLIGQGRLAQTAGNWDVQYVDLPPFSAQQSHDFLLDQAGEHAGRITDDLAAAAHSASAGQPGPLLGALQGLMPGAPSAGLESKAAAVDRPKRPSWHWPAVVALVLSLGAMLVFQDQINAWLTPGTVDEPLVQAPLAPEPMLPIEPPSPETTRPAVVPSIALPNLSRGAMPEQTSAGDSIEAAVASLMPELNAVEAGPAAVSTPVDDPLEAVMQDALIAADATATRQPPPIQMPATETTPDAPAAAESTAALPEQLGEAGNGLVAKAKPDRMPRKDDFAARFDDALKRVKGGAATPDAVPAPRADKPALVAQTERVVEAAPEIPKAMQPAPVEERKAAPVEPKTAASKPDTKNTDAVAPTQPTQGNGSDWLKTRRPGNFTLQLVGARDRASIIKFVRDNAIAPPHAVFSRDLGGKPWFSLVAGDYPSRDAAIAAKARLPKALQDSGVWPRTFESIHKAK